MEKASLDKELVLKTAAVIADAEGLGSVTLTRVAKKLGISQPALYRHVDGFDDLVRGLGLMGREMLGERLRSAAIGVSGDDAVRAMGLAWREAVRIQPGLMAATDRYPCAGDAELEEAVEKIVSTIGTALIAYDLDPIEQVHAARALRSTFHGFAHLEGGDGHPLPHDLDDTFDHVVDLLCAGLRKLARD